MDIVIFLLACVGAAHIIVDGSIMQWLHRWTHQFGKHMGWQWPGELIECFQCVGFHVSWLLSLIYNPLPLPWYLAMIICACAGSFSATLSAALVNFLIAQQTKE